MRGRGELLTNILRWRPPSPKLGEGLGVRGLLLLCAVALTGCGSLSTVASISRLPGHVAPAGKQAARTAPIHQSARTLEKLVAQPIPERNLYALTDELKLRPPRPIPHVIRRTSPNYPVGHQDSFYVLTEDKDRYFVMHATIRAETPHLYIYIQNSVKVPTAAVQKAANHFERSTYPTDRSFFGSEWRPGVDGDPHIICLVGDLKSSGAAGFYSAEDEYPRIVNPYSNQHEMVYINSTAMIPGDAGFNQTLAHEFQHMIHWHMHPHDNAWLNEGMSMLAEKLNKYPPQEEPSAFINNPDTQLNSWSLSGESSIAHYGAAYLFLAYLYDRFGRGLIHDLVADARYTDLELVNDVFKKHHIHETANQVFTQWVAANIIDDRSIAGGIYGYGELTQRVALQKKVTAPFSYQGAVPPYAAQYLEVDVPQGQKPFQLHFSAPTTVPVVAFQPTAATGAAPFWWSNRGDMSDTRLERTVDLRHVRHATTMNRVATLMNRVATLQFQAWYDIEKDYDYAYVEVSRDGGKTWDTLPGTHTTTSNPNGASYGNGYTGASQGWLAERVDLSRYAGQRIKLRFQYVTDDEYNGQSFAVKDITIPEIGFRDNFSGWRQDGFVPVLTNALPSGWTVQLISYTKAGVSVSKLPLSGARGSVLIDPATQGLKKLIVAVFTTAPKTTAQSTYQLSAG